MTSAVGVEMTRFGGAVDLRPLRQQPRAQPGHRPDARQQDQAARGVVEQVEADDHFLRAEIEAVDPVHQRVEHRNDQQQADQFVQQTAQRHLPAGGVLHAGADEGENAAADVGADHQTDRHRQADHAGAGQGRGEQDGGEAGVGNHREQRADQGVEQDVAGQRGENHLHALGVGDRRGGLDDQLQRENDQPQADADPAHLPEPRLFARQKENHPEEDQQRRQPRQVKRQHPRHQRGTDVGAEHGRQRRGQRHQALTDKGGDEHGGGVAALHHGGHDDAGDERQPALGHVLADHMAQVGTVDPQDAGSDDVRAPDQQGHGGKQIEQGEHAGPLW